MQSVQRALTAVARTATPRSISKLPRLPSTINPRLVNQLNQRSSYASASPMSINGGKPIGLPLNLPKWLSENSHLLQPPINNFCVYSDPMTVMVVGGPNARTDYHINETPEFFYQYKGRMLLKTVQTTNGKDEFVDVYINEGELFLLPGNVPHNPVRFADTVGVVIEQPRPAESLDRLRWYCENCGDVVHEAAFFCTDLGTQIKDAVNSLKADEAARTCKSCGTVNDTAPKPEVMERMRTAPS